MPLLSTGFHAVWPGANAGVVIAAIIGGVVLLVVLAMFLPYLAVMVQGIG